MVKPEDRLSQLGIELPDAVPSIASYVRTVTHGDVIYVSGQLPIVNGSLVCSGKVGSSVSIEEAVGAAKQCAVNAIAALKDEVGDLSLIYKIIKLTAFVASEPTFVGQAQVVNGASDLFIEIFGDAGRHARSAVGVASLPLDSPVEVEVIVAISQKIVD